MTSSSGKAPVQLLFDGRFSALVAAATAEALDATHDVRLRSLPAVTAEPADLLVEGGTTVLLTPRFDWHEVHAFDAASHRTNRPWCFVGYAYPYVVVGPYADPAAGPCYLCLQVRLKQHGRTEIPLEGRYLPVRGEHVEGIPRHLVYSVAGLLGGLLSAAEPARHDVVHLCHVNGLKVRSEVLVGVHRCQRCAASDRNRPGNAELLRVCRELWEEQWQRRTT